MEALMRDKKFRKIGIRLVLSFFLIFFLFFTKHLFIHEQLKKEQNISHTMNVIGQQRMLSQKLTKDLELLDQRRMDGRQSYIETLDRFEEGQKELQELAERDQLFYEEDTRILKLFDQSNPYFQAIIRNSHEYLDKMYPRLEKSEERAENLKAINQEANSYQAIIENLVEDYERINKKSLISIQRSNNFFFLAIIFLLIYIFYRVIQPLIQRSIEIYSKIKRTRKDLTDILDEMHGILFLVDKEGDILFLNQDAERLLKKGAKKEQLLNIFEDIDWLNFDLKEHILKGKKDRESGKDSEVLIRDAKGNVIPLALSFANGSFEDEEVLILTLYDLTKQKNSEELLKKLAIRDELTGLYNRHILETISSQEFAHSDHYNLPLSMVLMDIDDFKEVNDRYGHLAGDEILEQSAYLLKNNIRSSDYAVRIGGEEIALFLPNTNKKEAKILAEKIRKVIAQTSFSEIGQVTVSIGVAERNKGEEYSSLYSRVDEALYQAKSKGKNRVETFIK